MTYPSGVPQGQGGYQGQLQNPPPYAGGGQQPGSLFAPQAQQGHPGTQQLRPPAPERPGPLQRLGLDTSLALGVLLLAVISYVISLTGAGSATVEVYLLLAGGLLAGMSAAPKAPVAVLPVGTVLSVLGGLGMLARIVRSGGGSLSTILVLVFGVLQLLVAVAAYLMYTGLLTVPSSGPSTSRQRPPWGAPPPQQQDQQLARQQTVMTQQPQQPVPPQQPQAAPSQAQPGSVDLFGGQN